MNFKNKVVLVTGGSSGIGKSISKAFLKEGAKVIIFDIAKPDFAVTYYQVDISKENEIQKAISKIMNIDILVNNAGIYFLTSIENTPKQQLDRIIDVNFKGAFLMCKHVLPRLKQSKGNIVNIASALAVVPEPESVAYCSSKAAIVMLTKCLAQEYASKGIRVNAVLPGPIDTPLLRKAFASKKEMESYKKLNPMKKIGKPEDVANVVLFLASENAQYVTGGLYSVDGGEGTSSIYSK
jgi:NAD(P)-dependent dehydrogenase (short-subunit alcohol dehydrogenase family)